MSESVEACGARFFDEGREDLGRAVQVSARPRKGSTLTLVDVTGAEPELARILTRLDRGRLRIHWENAARTCYVFTWASGYSNGPDVRIQGILEPHTGHELEGWAAKAAPPPTPSRAKPDNAPLNSWNAGRLKRTW